MVGMNTLLNLVFLDFYCWSEFKNVVTILGVSALTCIDSIDKVNGQQESDKMIFGDTFGNVMMLEVNLSQVSYNNTKPDLVDPLKRVIDLDDFRDKFVKKKVHDEAVMKVYGVMA